MIIVNVYYVYIYIILIKYNKWAHDTLLYFLYIKKFWFKKYILVKCLCNFYCNFILNDLKFVKSIISLI